MVLPGFQNQINKKMVVWEELFENGVSLRSTDRTHRTHRTRTHD